MASNRRWMVALYAFTAKHAAKVRGTLSCFDRVLFRGYLPLINGFAMAEFLKSKHIDRWKLKPFLFEEAERIKNYYYVLNRQLGLIHVKVQTWFPLPIQIYFNGHEWLARRFDRHGPNYLTCAHEVADREKTLSAMDCLEGGQGTSATMITGVEAPPRR